MSEQDMARPLLSKIDGKKRRSLSLCRREGTLPCDPLGKHMWDNVPSSPRPMLLKMLSLPWATC